MSDIPYPDTPQPDIPGIRQQTPPITRQVYVAATQAIMAMPIGSDAEHP
jgi:hypothetical protein